MPKEKKTVNKKHLIILTATIVALVLGASIFFIVRGKKSNSGQNESQVDEASKPSYSTERDPETGERENFGADENKNNSGEAFVEYQERIIESEHSSNEDIFDAKIAQASYYIAIGEYDNAQAILDSLDQSTFSSDQQERFNNIARNLDIARNSE
ncbi:hypothetical protein IKE86_01550 [Candidatus Saccharibacteria bacterium]|nr:hypothetical protein [Candidatus Saccharibacteria bacterium]